MLCLKAMHMCMYLHVCRHVCILHTCTYALDTAQMSQDTYRYSQIHADTGLCISHYSHIHCAYVICIQLYPACMCVHVCAVCASHTCRYINPYWCCMCFRHMHICTGRITDGDAVQNQKNEAEWLYLLVVTNWTLLNHIANSIKAMIWTVWIRTKNKYLKVDGVLPSDAR